MMFSLRYELTGSGWSRCIITDGTRSFTATASYLGDALRDLLDAVAALAEGATEARAEFCEEPGEYRWVFKRLPGTDPAIVETRILLFEDLWTGHPDERGTEVFSVTLPVIDLCIATRAMAREVFKKHGTEGYLELWVNNPFPQPDLDRLDRFLSR